MEMAYGLAGIVLYLLTGYLKSGESFDFQKALRTLVIGMLLVGLNVLLGVEIPSPEIETLLAAGEVALAENIVKTLWRRLFSTL
ncbi:MAG: hypothetical protein RMI43_05395 [Candidatus Caldarchaeum sp.]|nr:hypothetical protein [Candidatus Caldarchaeum sp.]MCX8200820.1 hypothetical protein [Candidatus Caldarchaeum sp.]MDW8063585.1 hypothetical protein [Candidatus Caldarchaeum sp.]MDW8434802.1 hypothetical protein [Candidatus Caldarchaeum sp.]